jgi:hypothetical protein
MRLSRESLAKFRTVPVLRNRHRINLEEFISAGPEGCAGGTTSAAETECISLRGRDGSFACRANISAVNRLSIHNPKGQHDLELHLYNKVLTPKMFYEGDLQSGINKALQESKLVACFVAGISSTYRHSDGRAD